MEIRIAIAVEPADTPENRAHMKSIGLDPEEAPWTPDSEIPEEVTEGKCSLHGGKIWMSPSGREALAEYPGAEIVCYICAKVLEMMGQAIDINDLSAAPQAPLVPGFTEDDGILDLLRQIENLDGGDGAAAHG